MSLHHSVLITCDTLLSCVYHECLLRLRLPGYCTARLRSEQLLFASLCTRRCWFCTRIRSQSITLPRRGVKALDGYLGCSRNTRSVLFQSARIRRAVLASDTRGAVWNRPRMRVDSIRATSGDIKGCATVSGSISLSFPTFDSCKSVLSCCLCAATSSRYIGRARERSTLDM